VEVARRFTVAVAISACVVGCDIIPNDGSYLSKRRSDLTDLAHFDAFSMSELACAYVGPLTFGLLSVQAVVGDLGFRSRYGLGGEVEVLTYGGSGSLGFVVPVVRQVRIFDRRRFEDWEMERDRRLNELLESRSSRDFDDLRSDSKESVELRNNYQESEHSYDIDYAEWMNYDTSRDRFYVRNDPGWASIGIDVVCVGFHLDPWEALDFFVGLFGLDLVGDDSRPSTSPPS
jgi:hypothetical protein